MKLRTEYLSYIMLHRKAYRAALLPVCSKYQLSQTEADILLFLKNNPQYDTATDIAAVRGLSKPNISTALERLRRRDILHIERDSRSRRTNRITLLEEGQRIAGELCICQSNYFTGMLAGISDEEIQTVSDFFQKTNQNIATMLKQPKNTMKQEENKYAD
ncbi:MAG: MarR family transcriptional regulator [Lachnospiraceae bacterium]|nr:MarR family transcriptional regulator [Lachnospiraceae bacterium]